MKSSISTLILGMLLLLVVTAPKTDASFLPSRLLERASQGAYDMFQGLRIQQDRSSNPAADQRFTTENGAETFSYYAIQRAGKDGPLTFANYQLFDALASQNRERIPERTVHARGWGAHGELEITTDFAEKHSMADVFKTGTKTSTTCRFSTVGGQSGSPDTARDPRGFACKFRTRKGILDWVFNNTPVFFINNPQKFPLFIHTQKTDPRTHLRSPDMVFDYLQQNHEASHQFLHLFSPLGTPKSARYMNGWSGHTYRLVKEDGSWVYVKVLLESNQGIQNHTAAAAIKLGGENQEHATQDLFEAIDSGDFPSWTVKMAIMTEEEARNYRYSVFDLTKDWFDATYEEVGKLTLNRNPINYFEEVEQSHFSPSNMVLGWRESEDPVLMARLMSYNDAARHRLGVRYLSIPVNCPLFGSATFQRDGGGVSVDGNHGLQPNYPSSAGTYQLSPALGLIQPKLETSGKIEYFERNDPSQDYEQPRHFWRHMLDDDGRRETAQNFADALRKVKQAGVVNGTLRLFDKIDRSLRRSVEDSM